MKSLLGGRFQNPGKEDPDHLVGHFFLSKGFFIPIPPVKPIDHSKDYEIGDSQVNLVEDV
jgi:hypothetical protein